MNTIKKILIPTHFSSSAQNTVGYALKFAALNKNLEIFVLNVMENRTDEDRAAFVEQEMKKIEELFHNDSTCQCLIKTGNQVETILNIQKSLDIDLILMGTSGEIENKKMEMHTSQLVLKADG